MSLRDKYAIDRTHKAIVNNVEFQHHGIMGQRWGVITRNVGVNYVPMGRSKSSSEEVKSTKSSSSRNALTTHDLYRLSYQYGRRFALATDLQRKANLTDHGEKRIRTPLSPEGMNKKHVMTKPALAGQMALRGAKAAIIGKIGVEVAQEAVKNGLSAKGVLVGLLVYGYSAARIYDNVKRIQGQSEDKTRRNTLPVDEKTGFHVRTNNESVETDIKNVNPGHRKFTGDSNCPGCAVATELRARGYDVRAKDFDGVVSKNSLLNAFTGTENTKVSTIHEDKVFTDNYLLSRVGKNYSCANGTMRALSKEPEGSRGFLFMSYGKGGGHVTNYMVKNGKAVICEGQLGKVLRPVETNRILKNCYYTSYFRTDNLGINPKICKEVVE